MKVLFVGASGAIGGGVLDQCLAHPDITTVVAFVRRELPPALSGHDKVQSVIRTDFAQWTDDELQAHTDAAAMIWCMGSYDGNVAVDYDYPVAFQESFVRVLEQKGSRERPFRFVLLSGKFVTQDQDKSLCFLDQPRKLKGRLESRTLALAKQHLALWQAYICRPGGIISDGKIVGQAGLGAALGGLGALLGKNWAIKIEELGAVMAQAAAHGGEDTLIENARLVERGRELLKERAQSTKTP